MLDRLVGFFSGIFCMWCGGGWGVMLCGCVCFWVSCVDIFGDPPVVFWLDWFPDRRVMGGLRLGAVWFRWGSVVLCGPCWEWVVLVLDGFWGWWGVECLVGCGGSHLGGVVGFVFFFVVGVV